QSCSKFRRRALIFHNYPTCITYYQPMKYKLRLLKPVHPHLSAPHDSTSVSDCWSTQDSMNQICFWYLLDVECICWKHLSHPPIWKYSHYLANFERYSDPK